MLNTRNNYSVMHDHNYYYKNKIKSQEPNGQTYLKYYDILINDCDKYDTTCCVIDISSDEENYIDDNKPLSELLKIEYEKDIQLEVRFF